MTHVFNAQIIYEAHFMKTCFVQTLSQKLCIVAATMSTFFLNSESNSTDFASRLFKEAEFQELLKETGLDQGTDLQHVVNVTQKGWLRTGERWHPQSKQPITQQARKILDNFPLKTATVPSSKEYDAILILGATAPAMVRRLNFAQHLKTKTFFFLVGDRPLSDDVEDVWKKRLANLNRPQTEAEAARLIAEDNGIITVKIIATPMITTASGTRRPTTADTFDIFKSQITLPAKGNILVISSQPFVHYQQEVVLTHLNPQQYTIDVAGPEPTAEMIAEENWYYTLLDTLARMLYQHQERIKKPCYTQ